MQTTNEYALEKGRTLMLETQPLQAASPKPICTPRQVEVLQLIANGHSQKQIALALGITRNSVRHHIERAKKRTGMRQSEMLSYLTQIGIIYHVNRETGGGDNTPGETT